MDLEQVIAAAQTIYPQASGDRVGVRCVGGVFWIVTLFDDDGETIGRAEVDDSGAAQPHAPPEPVSLTGSI